MCGIWAILGTGYDPTEHDKEFMKIAGRGPDLTVISKMAPNLWFGFHRLAIVQPGDLPSAQPIVGYGLSVVCNGEIYNHERLKAQSPLENDPLNVLNGGSDCAAIIHAFRFYRSDLSRCCASLDGVFAFLMVDENYLYVGRDPIGVRPLFYGITKEGFVFGSEVKCIEKLCERVDYFPPGCCAQISLRNPQDRLNIQQYYRLPISATPKDQAMSMLQAQEIIRNLLIDSVEKRLMGNRLFGFMLSGGLDSSLIASIASRFLQAMGQQPIAFSVGFEDSSDLESARRVAKYLNIPHEILIVTPEECVACVSDVVYTLETFDPLVIRCGVLHFLLCKYIASSSDVKVLLSGEGADELFGSYAYMQRAPTHAQLHHEIIRRLKLLHQYDVLRCDRPTSCHGLEIRVPFLDKKFIDLVARLPPSYKLMENKKEKHILRSAFTGWLPDEVLWREKEGFSEALGKINLGEVLLEHASKLVTEEQFAQRNKLFPFKTPEDKEEFWYRALFEQFFEINKIESLIHTKVYRTAAWHVRAELANPHHPPLQHQNSDDKESSDSQQLLSVEDEETRFRRRSTGSAKFSGVA
ncbi:asparagine synthase domain-containing protein [Ditylenchus destructor]|nr:asparagine synthase domain-containing protein [Ditylenchus destructor]